MKAREELEAMTKTEIDAYGNETLGIDLDSRRKKVDMIDDILALQDAASPDPDVDADADADAEPDVDADADADADAEPKTSDLTVTVTVTRCPSESGVDLAVKRKRDGLQFFTRFHLPKNKPVSIARWAIPTLEAMPGVTFTKE